MHTLMRFCYRIAIVALFCSFLSFFGNQASAQAHEYHPRCVAKVIPVALAPGEPKHAQIYASLCQPERETNTVLVTYHGNTYAQYYWDFPFQPERYSFVDAMRDAGYAVLNLDRLPVDHDFDEPNSAQPASSLVTIASDTYALHQIVQGLRAGKIGEEAFSRVLIVGHSLGGYMEWQAAASYPHDFDGFIITGSAHPNSVINTNKVIPLLYQAGNDPKFKNAGLDAGYYTYKPGVRSVYYYLPNADPRVIALDNQLKQVTVLQELIDGIGLQSTFVSRSIHVPTLVVLGRYDLFACAPDAIDCSSVNGILKAESPYYSPQACLKVDEVPNAGHDLNLQKNAQVWYQYASHWINSFVVQHKDSSCGYR